MAVYLNSDWQKFVLREAGLPGDLRCRAGIWRLTDDAIDLSRVLMRQARGLSGSLRNRDRLGELFAQECLSLVQTVEPTTAAHPNDHSAVLILDALNWLRQNFAEKIHIDDLATELGVSRRHLTRLFRERTGLSVAEFLKEERLLEAQRLLEDTDWSIQQIAVMSGIENASQFTNAFSQRFGSTPTRYRLKQSVTRRSNN